MSFGRDMYYDNIERFLESLIFRNLLILLGYFYEGNLIDLIFIHDILYKF